MHQKEAADLEKGVPTELHSLPMCFSGFRKTGLNDLGDTVVMKTQILMIRPFYQPLLTITLMSICEDRSISKVLRGKITGGDIFNKMHKSEKVSINRKCGAQTPGQGGQISGGQMAENGGPTDH